MTTENQGCEESPRTRERLFSYLRHKSDCPMFVNASDYEKVWDAHSGTCNCNCGLREAYRAWATRETRGTAPRDFLNKWLGNEWTAEVTGEKLRINPEVFPPEKQIKVSIERICELLESYAAAERVSQPVAPPDAHRTLQAIFNELNDPESGESERWVKIEEILHQYFRLGTHPPQEGAE